MKNHTDLLNFIAASINAVSYLEIGVLNIKNNFIHINCRDKLGVDPNVVATSVISKTSDEFFAENIKYFDQVFVDGLHHDDQVERDVEHSWRFLKPGGVILIHDCNPINENITHVPRDSKEWTGNVYKAVSRIVSPKFTIDFDYGCCILRKTEGSFLAFSNEDISWEYFSAKRKNLLNLVPLAEGLKIIESWSQ